MSEQFPVVVTDAPAPHPIHLVVTDDLHRSRLTVFFRILLVIPAYIVVSVLGYVAQIVMFLAWLYALFAGNLHVGLRDVLAYWLRYNAQTIGYICLLTQRYPTFADD